MQFCCSLAFQDPTQFVGIARSAEATGWDYLVLSDHVVHPEKIRSPYPYTPDGTPRWEAPAPWADPWVAIGAMSSVTERIRFVTGIYVLPMRNPFLVAKELGTAAIMSGNRVTLGIGVGWMEEEFGLLGQSFRRRGARNDEMIEVMRKLWRGGMVEHHGEFYDFDRLQMSPAVEEPIPIMSGGTSKAALRRVGRLTDGWISDLHSLEELREIVAEIRGYRAEYGRGDAPLEIYAACSDAFGVDGCRQLEEVGVTHMLTMPWVFYGLDGDSLEEKQEGLRRFGEDVIDKLR
ncbi:MAG: LLM class F420-dependent oxidoreductase [Myxococcota bacterium]|nr:LLM class F420-dependent oxidoreductase [Myxococcota bacterium]